MTMRSPPGPTGGVVLHLVLLVEWCSTWSCWWGGAPPGLASGVVLLRSLPALAGGVVLLKSPPGCSGWWSVTVEVST